MSVAVSIVFTGLCALVADGDQTPGQVLLVDARGVGQVTSVSLPEHAPTLVASLGILANAESSGPTKVVTAVPGRGGSEAQGVDQIGLWDLRGSEVRIRVRGHEGTGLELYQPPLGASPWPNPPRDDDAESWRDLRFVPSMKVLTGDGRIDPALVAMDGAAASRLPRGVAARVLLDAGRVEAGLPSLGNHRHDIYEFRGARPGPAHRQALTDTLRWSFEAETSAVVVEIAPLGGGPVKQLVLAPSATPHRLFISNLPAENVPHDLHDTMSDQEMGAIHFGAYYALLMNNPGDKPLPWVWESPEPAKGSGLMARPICSPAVFSRR